MKGGVYMMPEKAWAKERQSRAIGKEQRKRKHGDVDNIKPPWVAFWRSRSLGEPHLDERKAVQRVGQRDQGICWARQQRQKKQEEEHAQSEPFLQEANQWKPAQGETCLMMHTGEQRAALREASRGGSRRRKSTRRAGSPTRQNSNAKRDPKRQKEVKLWLVVGGKWAEWADWAKWRDNDSSHPCAFRRPAP